MRQITQISDLDSYLPIIAGIDQEASKEGIYTEHRLLIGRNNPLIETTYYGKENKSGRNSGREL